MGSRRCDRGDSVAGAVMSSHPCPKCGKEMPATCPVEGCGKEVEVYSRIVGYLRPIRTWNDGKQEEFRQRKEFIINERWRHE